MLNQQSIPDLVARHRPGFALEQDFYNDPGVFEEEVWRIFLKSWLYVGHISQIPGIGDYFLFNMAGESVIIVHASTDEVLALINVCRHRGSRVCLEDEGKARSFVCRYHGWTYELDGRLRGASHMDEEFDRGSFGLKRAHVRVFQGLIFINLDQHPVSFDRVEQDMAHCIRPYGLESAKVAQKTNYPIDANWKLAVENYCECYHCRPSHPEYSRYHGRAVPSEKNKELLAEVMARADDVGLSTDMVNHCWLASGGLGIERQYDRYPLFDGCVTGSRDGKPVAPLLGSLKGYDGGATDIQVGPVTFFLAYCDHVVVYRFTPRSIHSTDCEITWLVNEKAEEGKDYSIEELTWLWDVTTIADKRIIENNQAGVNSRFYEPGPYSRMEAFTGQFVQWYLEVMK